MLIRKGGEAVMALALRLGTTDDAAVALQPGLGQDATEVVMLADPKVEQETFDTDLVTQSFVVVRSEWPNGLDLHQPL
jgi:hypothetical protein